VSTEASPESSVAIIGGGISGLSAAYHLEKLAAQAGVQISISLFDRSARLGGVIQTDRCDDFLIEGGPDSFLAAKPAAVELCTELGLGDELVGSNDARRKTYVFQGGRLRQLPDGLMFVVPTRVWPVFGSDLLSAAGKIRLAMAPLLPPIERRADDWSVADFISRRFGREVLDRLAEPLLAAVYGADVDELSARAALPQLVAIEEKYGNLWRGLPHARSQARAAAARSQSLFLTLRGGLGLLIERLQKGLKRTHIHAGAHSEVREIRKNPSGFDIIRAQGAQRTAAVVVAAPAPVASRLLQGAAPAVAAHLGGITHHSSVIVALGYDRSTAREATDGFGFVVPRIEGKALTACTFVSTKFSQRSGPDHVLLRCFLGSARNPSLLSQSDDEILGVARRELTEIIGLDAAPVFSRVYRWAQRMPQYAVGHMGRVEAVVSSLREHHGLYLAGNAYHGVGISDCIQSGCRAAAGALEYLRSRNS
jgi:oxygen-dependent protoporphyrinogen oxidase